MTKEKAQARREHLQKMRSEQKRKERRAAMLMWGAGGLVVVLLVGLVGFYLIKQGRETSLDAVANYPDYKAGEHVWNAVTYKETPPVGGQHNNYWQQCAVYDKPIHNEHGVHSLEHGAVWITYQPNLAKAKIDQLKKIATSTGQQDYMLMSPYPGLSAPVVASTWGHQLKLDSTDDPRLAAFIKKFQNGKDTPEPGAICGGPDAITTTADQAPLPPEPKQQNQPVPTESIKPTNK